MCGFENMSEITPIKMIITLQTLLSRKKWFMPMKNHIATRNKYCYKRYSRRDVS